MEELSTLALIAGGAAIAAAVTRAAFQTWGAHKKAQENRILELTAGGKTFNIDLGNIERVDPRTLKRASEAVRTEKERSAA